MKLREWLDTPNYKVIFDFYLMIYIAS